MSLPLLYRHTAADDSLLAQNDLLFRPSTEEVETIKPCGMRGASLDYRPVRNDAIVVTLLLSLVCGMVYWRKRKRALVALLFCVQCALLIFISVHDFHLVSPVTPSWLLLGVYTLVMGGYLCIKQGLYHWVHQIFFPKDQRLLWRNKYAFLLMVETVTMSPVVLVFIFLHLNILLAFQILAVVLLFVKIWLLWQCFSVFFRKKHGYLHLFVYFCTLEGAPLMVLSASVIEITRSLTFI